MLWNHLNCVVELRWRPSLCSNLNEPFSMWNPCFINASKNHDWRRWGRLAFSNNFVTRIWPNMYVDISNSINMVVSIERTYEWNYWAFVKKERVYPDNTKLITPILILIVRKSTVDMFFQSNPTRVNYNEVGICITIFFTYSIGNQVVY